MCPNPVGPICSLLVLHSNKGKYQSRKGKSSHVLFLLPRTTCSPLCLQVVTFSPKMRCCFSWGKDHAVTCSSLDALLFVTIPDENQLCLFSSGHRSPWLVVHRILKIFWCLFLLCFGVFTFLPGKQLFWGSPSSGFTTKETFEVVIFWAYAALRRVCAQLLKVSSYLLIYLALKEVLIENGILLCFCRIANLIPLFFCF